MSVLNPWKPLFACLVFILAHPAHAQGAERTVGRTVEQGKFNVHLLLHAIGSEEYTLRDLGGGRLQLTSVSATADRGMKRTSTATLEMSPRFEPVRLRQAMTAGGTDTIALTELNGDQVHVEEVAGTRSFARPALAFPGAGGMPAPVLMMWMRYWQAHGRPAQVASLRGSEQALPLEIRAVGDDTLRLQGKPIRLRRYTLANLNFGREVLWMDARGRLAAVMTFAGGLPQETLLDEYEPAMAELFKRGVQQEMLDLAELGRQVKPQATGTYAITGVRLIDGTGRTPVEHASVIIRDGSIAAVGVNLELPRGMRTVAAEGKSLLPGLWEMHSHYSGVEFGPALLSAGITTARDCGGEREFLVTVRRAIAAGALGPRLLLAGLVDSGGPLAFGAVDVETATQGRAAVDSYADAGFEQIKVYTQIQPEVLRAISAEAHRRGMTVTGHVPAAVDTLAGIADGMDQINHLQFVTREMTNQGKDAFDAHAARSEDLLALLKARQIVVDPTAAWGEMASHPKGTDVSMFEPGMAAAPWTLAGKFQAMGSTGPAAEKFPDRMKLNLAVLGALRQAGVPIVAGSDTNLLGYGLDRELELYVQAGMTPLEAIQTATLIPARVMQHEADSGTIAVGKRADLLLVEGDPSVTISDLRRVVSVVKEGRLYSAKELGAAVGFNR